MSKSDSDQTPVADTSAEKPRRNFMVAFLAIVIGGIVSVVPLIPGIAVFLDPLRRKRDKGGKSLRITTLDAVPADGLPHRFQVVDVRSDLWNRYPPEPIDAVYLIRTEGQGPPKAFAVVCPHLGCAVDFQPAAGEFQCPCHTSGFALDGGIKYGPSPRPMDELEVELRNDNEVWVNYKRFRVGKSDKIEV